MWVDNLAQVIYMAKKRGPNTDLWGPLQHVSPNQDSLNNQPVR